MTSIIERVKNLELPLDELVVIGSGLLDALGVRKADDIDLVVSDRLFAVLKQRGDYMCHYRGDEEYLLKADQEIWRNWGEDASFESLKKDGLIIDGVTFVNKEFLINWKLANARPKDLDDVAHLKEV